MTRRPIGTDDTILVQLPAALERGKTEPVAERVFYDPESGYFFVECRFAFRAEQVRGLENAMPEQLANCELLGGGESIYWPALDEGPASPTWLRCVRRRLRTVTSYNQLDQVQTYAWAEDARCGHRGAADAGLGGRTGRRATSEERGDRQRRARPSCALDLRFDAGRCLQRVRSARTPGQLPSPDPSCRTSALCSAWAWRFAVGCDCAGAARAGPHPGVQARLRRGDQAGSAPGSLLHRDILADDLKPKGSPAGGV